MNIKTYLYFLSTLLFIGCTSSDQESDVTSKKDEITKQVVDTIVDAKSEFEFAKQVQNKPMVETPSTKGKVKRITQKNFWYKKDRKGELSLTEKKLNRNVYDFDENGRLTSYEVYRDDNELFFTYHYTYDEEGSLISSSETNDSRFMVTSKPYFSKDGYVFKEALYNGFEIEVGENRLDFDPENRSITETKTWKEANTKSKNIYTYDSLGRLTRNVFFEKPLTQPFGNAAEKVWEYEYDESGNLSRELVYNPWGMEDVYTTRLYSDIKHTYDEDGNRILSEGIEDKKPVKLAMVYTFDDQKNWTSCEIKKNDIDDSKLEREYSYH